MKNELELRVGDYISEPNDEEIYSNEDFVLSQIVRKGDKYTRLFVEKLIVEDKLYDTINELKENLHKDAYLYYVEDEFEFDISKKGVVSVTFTVHTIFGDLKEEMVVNI